MCLFVCCPIKEMSCLTKLVHRRQNQGSNIQLARRNQKQLKESVHVKLEYSIIHILIAR